MVLRRNIYKGVYLQRGSGIGSIISSIFRVLVPFLKTGAKAAIKSAPARKLFKAAKNTAVKTAGTMARDVLSGRSSKASAKLNLKKAQAGIENALDTAFDPTPLKRKRKPSSRAVVIRKPSRAIRPLI
jgi:hypothetical protein